MDVHDFVREWWRTHIEEPGGWADIDVEECVTAAIAQGGGRMTTYHIRLSGCDADTEFDMEILDCEIEIVKRIADKSKEVSTYNCMPIMIVTEEESDAR